MSEVTTVSNEPETTEASLPPVELLSGRPVDMVVVERKVRGKKDEAYSIATPKLPEGGGFFDYLTKALGENGLAILQAAIIRELVKPAAAEASHEAYGIDSETGEPIFSEKKYVQAFLQFFQAPSRGGGGLNQKEILSKMKELTSVVMTLTTQSVELSKQGKSLPEPDLMKFASSYQELDKLSKLLESRTRGGKTKGGKKKNEAEPVAVVA